MFINLWRNFTIQKQTKLCPSSGNSKRKVTANPDCAKCKKAKVLKKLYKGMRKLEYILDSENQKRKRKDKKIKEAWGWAFYLKGLIIEASDFYEPTLMMIHYNSKRKNVNPTWTKKSVMMWEKAKAAEKAAQTVGE